MSSPDWLAHGGNSRQFPSDVYLTGVAAGSGADALAKAMTEAAADLANRIEVHIEHQLTDQNSESNGKVDYHIAAMTKLTSNLRLKSLKYEIAHSGQDVYALAYVKRADALADQRAELGSALSELGECLRSARTLRNSGGAAAAARYQQCIAPVARGLQREAVIRGIAPKSAPTTDHQTLLQGLREIREATDALTAHPATSVKEAAEYLALQLTARRNGGFSLKSAPSFRYGSTNFSSAFGQQLSLQLESALAKGVHERTAPDRAETATAIIGAYFEEGPQLRITATMVEIPSGKILAGAETVIARSYLPSDLLIVPKNLESALADQRLLAQGELVAGSLHVEVWADRGRRGVVYTESEEIRLFVRVNTPAYVRLVYVLESGVQVPIDQAYYIDASKVNMAVEYPGRFEVAPPFGIEHIHATAFTKQPPPLPVTTKQIDGVSYAIVADGMSSLVRHRGIKRKVTDDVAESLLTITTLPRVMRSPN